MALHNPKAILKLWKKANDKLGFGSETETTKVAQKKNVAAVDVSRVTKKLTHLAQATAELPVNTPQKIKVFDKKKTAAVMSLQKCCRVFKSKGEDTKEVKDFNKMRNLVLQVTKVVSDLDAGKLENTDGEPQLADIAGVQVGDLEEKLKKDDNFGKFDPSVLDHNDESEGNESESDTSVQGKKPVPSNEQKVTDKVAYEDKLKKLQGPYDQARQTFPVKRGAVLLQMRTKAENEAKTGDYSEALKTLVTLEQTINAGGGEQPVPQPHGPSPEQLKYKEMLVRLKDRITEGKSAPPPTGTEVSQLLVVAQTHASKLEFKEAVAAMERLELKLKSITDAHGNVRDVANKEDAMVNKFINTVLESPGVVSFQKKKFGDRMNRVAGKLPGVNWEDMIGKGDESDPFDVISQIGVFKEGTTEGFDVGSKKDQKISYLTFQDALYGDEFESRAKLVMALASKKRKTLTEKSQQEKLDQLVTTLKDKWQVVKTKEEENKKDSNKPRPSQQEMTELKSAMSEAFTFVGLKGVSEDVQSTRDQIKNGLFLGKDNPFLSRGRKAQSGTEKGRGIGSDDDGGSHEVYDSKRLVFMGKNVNIRDDDTPASNVFRELGIPFTGGASGSTVDAVGGIVDDVVMGNVEDKRHLGELVQLQKEKEKIVKEVENTKHEELLKLTREKDQLQEVKPVSQPDMLRISQIEKQLEETDARYSKEIEEKTAGLNVRIEQQEKAVQLKPDDPRLAQSEAEICMYIMGMHSAGHHSIVEMLYAAKQYPQKFFRNVPDPITQFNELQEKRLKFYASNPLSKFQNPQGTAPLDKGEVFKRQQEAMLRECPENIVSHEDSVKEFMKYAAGAIKKV